MRGLLLLGVVLGLMGGSVELQAKPEEPGPVGAEQFRTYAADAERELRGDILPFWLAHARDPRGGFFGRIDYGMRVYPDAPRGMLLTARILWTFSAAYRRFHDPAYLAMAKDAYRDLITHGIDPRYGGLFWTVAPDGKPVVASKLIYGEVFGIYGLAEYYRTTHDQAALDQAIALYRLVEQHAHDHRNGGYFEGFDRAWRRDDRVQLKLMGGNGPKSQNTHIHILEAYTNLLRVWPDPGLKQNVRELTDLLLTRIIDPKTHHLILFFQDDWTPVSDVISFGHDIELSWLIVEAAEELGDPALVARAKAESIRIARATAAQGVDRDGGIMNEADPHGLTNTNKDWWPQAEACTGFLNAYQLTGDPAFFADSRHTWEFIQTKGIDRKNGDWYQSVTRDGQPRPLDRLSVWKCPYHNSRACLQLIDRCEALESAGR